MGVFIPNVIFVFIRKYAKSNDRPNDRIEQATKVRENDSLFRAAKTDMAKAFDAVVHREQVLIEARNIGAQWPYIHTNVHLWYLRN